MLAMIDGSQWRLAVLPAAFPLALDRIKPFFLMIKLLPMKALELRARINPTLLSGLSITTEAVSSRYGCK